MCMLSKDLSIINLHPLFLMESGSFSTRAIEVSVFMSSMTIFDSSSFAVSSFSGVSVSSF